jgi:UDP-glucose:(glucosyl)LPS alpha-1,2-glucosyltransferase
MQGFEENEISKNAFGGTEITKRSLAKLVPEELASEFQIIPSRVREIQDDKIRVYWVHDLAEDPELNHLKDASSRNRFHKFVFNCNWQMNDFVTKLNMPFDEKMKIIETPVEAIPYMEKDKEKVNLIYFSTPQRGLEILVPVFEELAKTRPNVHLNVFSSFKIYGWEEADKQYQPLYDRIRNHPQMTYHGFSEREVLSEYIQKSHILAYPCVWKETACRVLIESMSAGLLCVHPNLAALSDTGAQLTSSYQFMEDINKHANDFFLNLCHAVDVVNEDQIQNYLRFVKAYTDRRFNPEMIASQWENMMIDLKNQYQTIDSRKPPGQVLIYKTT